MKGSSGAGCAAFFFGILAVATSAAGSGHASDVFGVAALGLLAVHFICRSIESLKEES